MIPSLENSGGNYKTSFANHDSEKRESQIYIFLFCVNFLIYWMRLKINEKRNSGDDLRKVENNLK